MRMCGQAPAAQWVVTGRPVPLFESAAECAATSGAEPIWLPRGSVVDCLQVVIYICADAWWSLLWR
jgi:hypothetical protein